MILVLQGGDEEEYVPGRERWRWWSSATADARGEGSTRGSGGGRRRRRTHAWRARCERWWSTATADVRVEVSIREVAVVVNGEGGRARGGLDARGVAVVVDSDGAWRARHERWRWWSMATADARGGECSIDADGKGKGKRFFCGGVGGKKAILFVAHGCGCATEMFFSVAHPEPCATK